MFSLSTRWQHNILLTFDIAIIDRNRTTNSIRTIQNDRRQIVEQYLVVTTPTWLHKRTLSSKSAINEDPQTAVYLSSSVRLQMFLLWNGECTLSASISVVPCGRLVTNKMLVVLFVSQRIIIFREHTWKMNFFWSKLE